MSALIHLLSKNQGLRGKAYWLVAFGKRFAHLSEAFWFVTSMLLFIAIGLCSLAKKGQTKDLQSPAKV